MPRNKHWKEFVKYESLSRNPDYAHQYPKRTWTDFHRWFPGLDPAYRDQFSEQMEKDYKKSMEQDIKAGMGIVKRYLSPDPDVQTKIFVR